MNKLTFIFNVILILPSAHAQSMQEEAQLALNTEEQHYSLANFHDDILSNIFHCLEDGNENRIYSMKQDIKNFITLRGTCKRFNQLLTPKKISEFIKNYPLNCKNWRIDQLKTYICYQSYHLVALTLIYAGANANNSDLLDVATWNNDPQFIKILFEHKANANNNIYTFFNAKTVEIVQMFIDKGINVHATLSDGKNVLWYAIEKNYPLEVLELYLQHHVDPQILVNGSCLLHALASERYDDAAQKGKLLIDAMPRDMITQSDRFQKTPLEVALYSLRSIKSDIHQCQRSEIRLSDIYYGEKNSENFFRLMKQLKNYKELVSLYFKQMAHFIDSNDLINEYEDWASSFYADAAENLT